MVRAWPHDYFARDDDVLRAIRFIQSGEAVVTFIMLEPSPFEVEARAPPSIFEINTAMASIIGFAARIWNLNYPPQPAKKDGAVRIGLLGASGVA